MGNAEENIFECSWWLDKDCVMQGGGGNDEFNSRFANRDFDIVDFRSNGSDDKLVFQGDVDNYIICYGSDENSRSTIASPNYEGCSGTGNSVVIEYDINPPGGLEVSLYVRKVTLKDADIRWVGEWINIVMGVLPESYRKQGFTELDLPELKRNNPIQLK